MGQELTNVTVLRVAVDYRTPLQHMLTVSGCHHVDRRISARASDYADSASIVDLELGIFHFDRFVPTEKALNLIRTHDKTHTWKPALIEHLACFAQGKVSQNAHYPVSALGFQCAVRGRVGVPCLEKINSMRMLIIDGTRWYRGWEPRYRFLTFRQRRKRLLSRFFTF